MIMLLLFSCEGYNKLLKSQDPELKYSYAKKYFNQKKFTKSASLLESVVHYYRGRPEGEEVLYMIAQSYYGQKDYGTASEYFKAYWNLYPRGEFTELSKYYSFYGLYLQSPDARLDQTPTHEAISQILLFLEDYPQSEQSVNAKEILFELQDKLAYKEYRAAKLYYDLGTFMGNNYRACVLTADNVLKIYPFTNYREELYYLKIKSKHELAIVSDNELIQGRYRDVVDEYYNYMNEFPEGKYVKEVKKYFDYANSRIEKKF